MRRLTTVLLLLVAASPALSATIVAEAFGSSAPPLATYPATLVNGDFWVRTIASFPPVIGDGEGDITEWTFDFTTDPRFPFFATDAPLQSAHLTLTLTPGDALVSTDQINSSGFPSVNTPAIQALSPGVTSTTSFDLLDYWPSSGIQARVRDYLGLFAMAYEDDAIVSYARLELVTIPEPATAVLWLVGAAVGLAVLRRRRP